MIQLRRIEKQDAPQVVDFAIEGLRAELYPMHVDQLKVEQVVATFCHPHPDRFQLAAFDGSRMVAGIAAAVMPMLFFERCEAHIVMFRSVRPGAGVMLLRALRRWVAKDMRIRRVVWPMEFHTDERTLRLARVCGFDSQMALCVHYKG